MESSVSVVIPIRNRPELIDACLRSLSEIQRPAGRFEVIVVDDASTDATPEAAERWADKLPLRVIRSETQRGPGAARNLGSETARGDILAFIDGDCLADKAWLSDLLSAFEDPGVVAVGGGIVSAQERTWVQRYEGSSHPAQRGPAAGDVAPGAANDFLAGCNIIVRRTSFRAIGGFDETHHLGEDVDLIWRLAAVGRVRYRPDGTVAHHHVDRLWTMLRRRVDLGSSEAVLFRRHPANRRSFHASAPQLAIVTSIVAALTLQPWFAAAAGAALVADHVVARRRVRNGGLPAGHGAVARALLRAHASVGFRAMTLIDRYYALPIAVAGIVAGFFWRPMFLVPAALVAASIAISVVEWIRVRPGLGFARFSIVRMLDHFAMHAGIVFGCAAHRTLMPLRIRLRLVPWTIDILRSGHAGAWVEGDPILGSQPTVDQRSP